MDEPKSKKPAAGTLIVAAVVVALAVVVVVFALLNREGAEEKMQLQNDAVFLITAGGETVQVSMEDMESLTPRDIEATYKKSGKKPEIRTYTGVPLADILALKGVDASGYTTVTFTAADGYASALPLEEALSARDCFIVVMEGGEPLGKREDGGSGPFRMILPNDEFSQRWCSFLMEVQFQ